MQFSSPLIEGILLRRYKRFLADVKCVNSGAILTAHCPNTGTMRGCSDPGSRVLLSVSDNPKRKYPHTLELVSANGFWVGVNTARTNKLVREAIEQGRIEEFAGYSTIRQEIKTSDHTRLDLKIGEDPQSVYIEVKNCSLAEDGVAMFPDAVTTRGTKHLQELQRLTEQGKKACIFFLVQREDADSFRPADHIDPRYGQTLRQVVASGVLVLTYQAEVTPREIIVKRRLPVLL